MKKVIFIFLIFSINFKGQEKTEFKWNLEKEKRHNENRNDSTKWSLKNWKLDNQNLKIIPKPIVYGVFPVPKYELIDSTFNGLGNSGNWNGLKLKDKKIIHHSFYVNSNATNKEFTGSKPNEVFFTIVVLTDTIDSKRYSHTSVGIRSRNYPHYIGQGFVKTKSNEIDFISFLTADRNNYAIINMRLFDLRIGRIILIAPQKDRTFRSLQLNSPIMSSEEMDEYIEKLISEKNEVINFFTKKNNI